jgi:hypothetical protein
MLGSVTKGGTKLTYVPVSEVIQRLNDVLGLTAWSWETDRVWRDEHDPEWVIATGKLTATIDGVTATKAGEGGVRVKKMKSGEPVDLGDEFKGAASDALKKAAQKFGVALYLSRKPEARRYEEPAPTRDPVVEGWVDADEQNAVAAQLAEQIKAAGPDIAQAMREYRSRLGVLWPPTKDEHDELSAELQRLVGRAGELAAPQPASGDNGGMDDRTAAASHYVKGLDAAQLLVEFARRKMQAPRPIGEQRVALAAALVADPKWEPAPAGQETLV